MPGSGPAGVCSPVDEESVAQLPFHDQKGNEPHHRQATVQQLIVGVESPTWQSPARNRRAEVRGFSRH